MTRARGRLPPTPQRAAASRVRVPVPEKAFMAQVVKTLEDFGWLVYHTWRSDHSPKGYPDITAVRNGEILFIETKGFRKDGSRGKVTKEQAEWLTQLDEVIGVTAFAMWPGEWEKLQPFLGRSRSTVRSPSSPTKARNSTQQNG